MQLFVKMNDALLHVKAERAKNSFVVKFCKFRSTGVSYVKRLLESNIESIVDGVSNAFKHTENYKYELKQWYSNVLFMIITQTSTVETNIAESFKLSRGTPSRSGFRESFP